MKYPLEEFMTVQLAISSATPIIARSDNIDTNNFLVDSGITASACDASMLNVAVKCSQSYCGSGSFPPVNGSLNTCVQRRLSAHLSDV